jgi:hypothetical protein
MPGATISTPRVIIAVRVSSEAQQEQGFGHANQLRRLPEMVRDSFYTCKVYNSGRSEGCSRKVTRAHTAYVDADENIVGIALEGR